MGVGFRSRMRRRYRGGMRHVRQAVPGIPSRQNHLHDKAAQRGPQDVFEFMSATIETIITCDGNSPQCEGNDWSADIRNLRATEQRRRAKQNRGWHFSKGKDFCLACWNFRKSNTEPCRGANQKNLTMKPESHEEPQAAVGSGDGLCDGSGSVCRECSGTGWLVRNLRCGDVERYPCDCPISGRVRIPSNGTPN